MHDVVCGRRPLLHGLKEAPESFRMVIPFTGANLATRRATDIVAEVITFCCSTVPVDFAGSRHLSELLAMTSMDLGHGGGILTDSHYLSLSPRSM
ncbi:hypothetical protein [Salmonella bongori]|uniref:hypothetical protein n=1 Tax=Salmonella bongori TaxID=54736 RepID=UPI0015C53C78|nr:hypothetical protein [Salmonella bongori]